MRQAQELTRHCRGWLVIWSPWRRTYTAFACFTPESVVLDADAPHQLLIQMQQTERHAVAMQPAVFQGRGL